MASPQDSPIIIAENGDVLFTLRDPGLAFAVWERTENDSENHADEGRDEKHDTPLDDAPSDDASSDDTTLNTPTTTSNQPAPSESIQPDVVYKVSFQHLISASPKFKSELTSWSESRKKEDGFYHVGTEGWDPEALVIFLNILHLRYRQVPRSLSLELLAKVAQLVGYYRCWEAFDLIADVWVVQVSKAHPVPLEYSRELMLWMLISWVFKLDTVFRNTTLRALRQSDEESIRDMELAIPPAIIETVETRRLDLIQEVIDVCNRWTEKFCGPYQCSHDKNQSFNCGSILLGALTKQMYNMHISWTTAEPFSGLSLEELEHGIKSMRMPTWHVQYPRPPPTAEEEKQRKEEFEKRQATRPYYDREPYKKPAPEPPSYIYLQHICSLDPVVRGVQSVIKKAQGLELKDFVDRAETATDIAPPQS